MLFWLLLPLPLWLLLQGRTVTVTAQTIRWCSARGVLGKCCAVIFHDRSAEPGAVSFRGFPAIKRSKIGKCKNIVAVAHCFAPAILGPCPCMVSSPDTLLRVCPCLF